MQRLTPFFMANIQGYLCQILAELSIWGAEILAALYDKNAIFKGNSWGHWTSKLQ